MESKEKSKAKFPELISRALDAFFLPARGRLSLWFDRLWAAALYLLGLLHWGLFLNWGKILFDLHDWTQAGAYLSFLRQAALSGQLPLFIGSTLVTTDRYLGRPDTLISPQAYLLRFLEPGPFTLVNVLILFSVGFTGLLLLKRRYHLSAFVFTILFGLFNFNGNITAHTAVGHTIWTGYYFLPFFALLVLRAVEGEKMGWTWVLLNALTLFFMTLQGAYHFFLWCLLFLLTWGVFASRHLVPVLKVIVCSALLSLVRLLPPAVEFIGGGKNFVSGFPTVADLFTALVTLKYPAEALAGPFKSLGWWELDTYVGLLGLAFLVFFGLVQTWRKKDARRSLLAPIGVITFLSIGQIYSVVNHLPIPLTDSERISSRFFILPLVMLIVLGSFYLQGFLTGRGARSIPERILGLGLLVLLLHDLFQHSRIWRVENMYSLFVSTPVDISAKVLRLSDPPYISALIVGGVVSLLTFIVLLILSLRERQPVQSRQP
jgi:hypothetical protein